MTIIEAKELHIDELKDVGTKTYREHFSDIWSVPGIENYLSSQFNTEKILQEIKSGKTKYFLVVDMANTIGFLKLNMKKNLPNSTNKKGLEIEKIYLLKGSAGTGLGTQLIDFIHDFAVQTGEKFIWLDVLKNNYKARKFYERNGFIVICELEFGTDKEKMDMWVMKKDLEI